MKNVKFFALAVCAALGLAGCVKENGGTDPNPIDGKTGYLAVTVDLQKQTRGSDEQPASAEESALMSIYLVTFDATGTVVANPAGGYHIALDATQLAAANSNTVFTAKVSAAAKKVMAVANPGTKLLAALNGLNSGSTYALFNAIIKEITISEVDGGVTAQAATTTGFAMISTPADAELAVNGTIENALIDISPKVVDGTIYATDADAIAAATAAPVKMAIERLSSKIVFKPIPATVEVLPTGANFAFTNWTVDAVNGTVLPFAKKTIIAATHSVGGKYKYNFYTEDPNYADVAPYHTGLVYATIDPATKAPVLPWAQVYGWKAQNDNAYLVENTMAAAAQRYGNATRIVIKGVYTPVGYTANSDWFQFAGVNYQTLADLRSAAAETTASDELKAACEAFAVQMGAADFASLTEANLSAKVPYGGEFAKVPVSGVGIRYYQNGINYWFYEIRHNGEANGTMEYSKYGVVRNNWYNCTLNKVSGAGTPWYPDLINPGDGDPKPEDPIDSAYGYIGIEITPQPWIVWENGMTI